MSSFDITRINSAAALRETRADVPAKPRDAAAQGKSGGAAQPGVLVETAGSAGLGAGVGEPPVDAERVAQIRTALEQGTYPLSPSKIADAIVAARLMLSVGE